MLIVDIGTAGKWSGRRVAQSVKKKKKRYRVVLANGTTIFVPDVTIVGEVEAGVDKQKEVCDNILGGEENMKSKKDIKIAYKLLKIRKNGTLGPLFINRKQIIIIGKWLQAKCYPTKGYAIRQGWHVCEKPIAPHLNLKNRQWHTVEIKNFVVLERPASQGSKWFIAQQMKVIKPTTH